MCVRNLDVVEILSLTYFYVNLPVTASLAELVRFAISDSLLSSSTKS